ncbi:MAG: universal stress protein [Marivita sp.]|uniref:universal stress protein n=1 Tax=Marivita sp. TaxID=2003365 RepID=UPI0025B83F63|nr:universal stress protein [Marivita sp.]MCI5110748.1 universal stress protein [Marivita sp.]
MFNRIMVPVDLAHVDKLERALRCASDLAQHYGATLVYVGVAAATPGSVAHTPQEFAQKMADFAEAQGAAKGVTAEGLALTSHDPTTDLDPTLLRAIDDTGADLVVMASHVPNLTDYIWPSNGGTVAKRAKVSVMVVR